MADNSKIAGNSPAVAENVLTLDQAAFRTAPFREAHVDSPYPSPLTPATAGNIIVAEFHLGAAAALKEQFVKTAGAPHHMREELGIRVAA